MYCLLFWFGINIFNYNKPLKNLVQNIKILMYIRTNTTSFYSCPFVVTEFRCQCRDRLTGPVDSRVKNRVIKSEALVVLFPSHKSS